MTQQDIDALLASIPKSEPIVFVSGGNAKTIA